MNQVLLASMYQTLLQMSLLPIPSLKLPGSHPEFLLPAFWTASRPTHCGDGCLVTGSTHTVSLGKVDPGSH
jgi:hypothetical protein